MCLREDARGVNDTEAPKLLSEGVDLTGEIPVSNDLPRRYAPASVHEDELEALAPVLNDAAVSRALGASDVPASSLFRPIKQSPPDRNLLSTLLYGVGIWFAHVSLEWLSQKDRDDFLNS